MKKRLFAILTATILLLGTAGCSSNESSTETASNSNQLEEFDIVLDWYPNAVHGFIYDAIEKGYYEEEGLKVNVLFPANNNDAISLTAAGKADAGLYYQNDIIMTRVREDVPVKAIGTVVQEPLDLIAFLAEENITRPKDLEGKTLGYTGVEFGEAVIKKIMENDGSSIDKLNLVNVGFDLMSSMTTGNVNATFGCFINHEIPQLEKEGFDMDYFRLSDYGIPNYYSLVLVAGEKNLEENTEKYEKFLRASAKGFEDMKNNPDEVLEILLNNQNQENFPLDPDVEKMSMEILLPMMEKENAPFLYQDPQCYQENIDWLYENGLISEKTEPSDIIFDIAY